MAQASEVQVGERVRAFRIAAGIKQTELAQKLGISYQQVQKYETGKDNISVNRLLEIANALDQPPAVFLEEPTTNEDIAHNRHSLSLMRWFNRIPEERHRQLVIDVVKHLAQKGK